MRCSIAICLMLAGGLTVAGCSSSSAGRAVSATTSTDPCSWLTNAEVTAITTDVVTRTDSNGATCNYHSDPNDGMQVTVYPTGGAAQMETARTSARVLGGIGGSIANKSGAQGDVGAMLKQDTSAPPKLGDEAMWELNDALAVRKGDAFVDISPATMHDPATHTGYPLISKQEKRAIATAVAAKILAKLGH